MKKILFGLSMLIFAVGFAIAKCETPCDMKCCQAGCCLSKDKGTLVPPCDGWPADKQCRPIADEKACAELKSGPNKCLFVKKFPDGNIRYQCCSDKIIKK
jgi:hypothetical protein